MASRAYCCAVGGGPADVAALMVGRDRELSRVTRLFDDALAGQGRLVLCTGESGIGKTRLGEELTAAATAPGTTYQHKWKSGDVIMWDNRATMHRGRPWPGNEARYMVRTTISATVADGLETMRPPKLQAAE